MGPVGGAVAGSALQTAGSIGSTFLSNRANRELSREIRHWNLDQWHRQNEYNTPKAQMQRMRDAGLNPNLMYGQGDVGNAGAVQSVTPPRMERFDIGDPIGTYYDLKAKSAQARIMSSEAELKEAEARNAAGIAERNLSILGSTAQSKSATALIDSIKAQVEQRLADPKNNQGRSITKSKYGKSHSYDSDNSVQERVRKSETINRELEAKLKQLHVEMREVGLEPGSQLYFKLANRIIRYLNKKYSLDLPEVLNTN